MPNRNASRLRAPDMAYIALFAVLIAVCAWISIPFAVPFTLQTFAVFSALLTLGGRRGTYAVLVYLLLGAVGFPVFSGFQGGLGVLLGATGGYLTGLPAAALVFLAATSLPKRPLPGTAACLLGLAACYACGTAWYTLIYTHSASPTGARSVLSLCVYPFLIPDLLKLALASAFAGRLRKLIK